MLPPLVVIGGASKRDSSLVNELSLLLEGSNSPYSGRVRVHVAPHKVTKNIIPSSRGGPGTELHKLNQDVLSLSEE